MRGKKKKTFRLLRRQPEQLWRQEMGLPLRVLLESLTLLTWLIAAAVMGGYRLLQWAKRH